MLESSQHEIMTFGKGSPHSAVSVAYDSRKYQLTIYSEYIALAVLIVVSCICGCGKQEATVDVSGTVTLNGAGLPEGIITFDPLEKNGQSDKAVIKDGTYRLQLLPGKRKVRIEGFKVVGERPFYSSNQSGPTVPVKKQVIPGKYNTRSELECEISMNGGPYNFAL